MPHVALVYQNVRIPFIFEEAEAAGFDLTLVHHPDRPPPLNLPGVARTLALDIASDQDAAIGVLREAHRLNPFDGVLTLYEPWVPFTARAADALGLPGISEDAALAARNKGMMRATFAEAGLNYPRFVCAPRPDDLPNTDRLAKRLALPVVVKPASGYSSQGVVRVDDWERLSWAVNTVDDINRKALAAVSQAGRGAFTGIVVEEFVNGPEYAVESFAVGGEVQILSINHKGNPQGPFFEELSHLTPAPLDEDVKKAVIREVSAAALALGLTDGPAHTELRLRDGTTPYVLEIGARFGGSGVSHYLVQNSVGVNFARLALQNAVGLAHKSAVAKVPDPVATAGIYIIQTRGHGTIAEIEGLDRVAAHPETGRLLQFLFPGDKILPYPRFSGYPGFVLSRHRNFEAGLRYQKMLDRTIEIRYTWGRPGVWSPGPDGFGRRVLKVGSPRPPTEGGL
jgi:biotin carboxylase